VVDRGFDPLLGQTNDNQIGICCFSAKHTVLMGKNKDWLARNQDSASEWRDMSSRGLWASTIKENPANRVGVVVVVLCDYAPHHGTNSIVFLLLNRIGEMKWKSMDSWTGTKHVVFCSGYKTSTLLLNLRRGI
jgi:hypothetical protein